MLKGFYFDADDGKGGGGADADKGKDTQTTDAKDFESWLDGQDDKVKELYQTHTSGLKSALEKERGERKDLSDQLKELLPKAEKGSELEKQLTETVGKLEAAEKRASFVEQAIKPEIGCVNVKAAYALALADDLFDKHGDPDWDELKKSAPELFRKAGKTDGGAGGDKTPGNDINAAIRRAAGRG
jgi:predicted nuclease with TOPRIM domain